MYNGTGRWNLKHLQHSDTQQALLAGCAFEDTAVSVLLGDIQGPTTCTAQPKCTKTQFSLRTVTTELLLKYIYIYFIFFNSRSKISTLTNTVSKVYKHNGNTKKYFRITIWIYLSLFSSFGGRQNELQNLGLVTAKERQLVSASNIRNIPASDGQHVATPSSRAQHRGDLVPTDTTKQFPAKPNAYTSLP